MVTDKPMAKGPEPLRSVLVLSHVANTVITNTKVINISMTNPWPPVTPGPRVVNPKLQERNE